MKKAIKVVFTKDVEKNLKGDETEVKIGYARNYLFPQDLAIKADNKEAKELIAQLKEERAKRVIELEDLKKKAEKLSGKEVKITVKAGPTGKLFGAVTEKDIAKELDLSEDKINMQPIKETGKHNVTIKFGANIKTNIVVEVNAQTEKVNK